MSDKIKVEIGGVFEHPNLGLVRYIGPDRKYTELTCEIAKANGRGYSRFPLWQDLYDLGFDLKA